MRDRINPGMLGNLQLAFSQLGAGARSSPVTGRREALYGESVRPGSRSKRKLLGERHHGGPRYRARQHRRKCHIQAT